MNEAAVTVVDVCLALEARVANKIDHAYIRSRLTGRVETTIFASGDP